MDGHVFGQKGAAAGFRAGQCESLFPPERIHARRRTHGVHFAGGNPRGALEDARDEAGPGGSGPRCQRGANEARRNYTPENAPGIEFFANLRAEVVDAYYTSPEGIEDLGYRGNQVVERFDIPEEALRYAISRSPFAPGE